VHDCELVCDSFLLPPEYAAGEEGMPSSLGCVAVFQGMEAALGFPANIRWLSLAYDEAARAAHPEAGPLGPWRPAGPLAAPRPSLLSLRGNHCVSSTTPSTYCFHLIDLANLAFGTPTLGASVRGNACQDSETCIALEHVHGGRVVANRCTSQAFGVELHDTTGAIVRDNTFDFPPDVVGCEVRVLELGEKLDPSRVLPEAGVCMLQD
jgi:hypothetical protein